MTSTQTLEQLFFVWQCNFPHPIPHPFPTERRGSWGRHHVQEVNSTSLTSGEGRRKGGGEDGESMSWGRGEQVGWIEISHPVNFCWKHPLPQDTGIWKEAESCRRGKLLLNKQGWVSCASAVHMLFYVIISIFTKTHLPSTPLPQIRHLYNSQHLSKSRGIQTILYNFVHLPPPEHSKLQRWILKGMFQNVKALYYLCLGRWSFHRKEWKPSCFYIEISNLYQWNTTRKRKWIQSSPLILKLVNNYLGSISDVFCASWLVSKQSGACEKYLGTLRFLYRTIISGGVYEEQGGDSMQSACLLLQHSTHF